jgi:diketogulonate reductase-like aldo/keto reductase
MKRVRHSFCREWQELKTGTEPGQVLLRWATQKGIAVIPKTNSANRLQSNLDNTSFDLTESEIEAISALNINLRVRLAESPVRTN